MISAITIGMNVEIEFTGNYYHDTKIQMMDESKSELNVRVYVCVHYSIWGE